jgi:isopentenyl diphosphate isomerase/L-lactate dehydrogenase-like FMN-dependent dehydrogenase
VWDLRAIAKRRTPRGPFDYTDGGSEREISLNRSREIFQRIEFQPRILQDVSKLDLKTHVLGDEYSMPVGIAPTGFTRMMHAEGEIAGARAAAKFGIPFTLSTLGTTTIEDVVASAPQGSNWFQLYMWKDRDASMALVERARAQGVKNLLLTVDVPVAGARLRDVRNGLTVPPTISLKTIVDAIPRREWWWNFLTTKPLEFASMSNWPGTVAELLDFMFDPTMTFEDLAWLRKQWDGNLIVKGIQTLEDAKRAARAGADAVILSNHGGRQLDRAPVPLMLVQSVAKELKKDCEVHVDTGIMSGADIVAAIALGAKFTYIGKAYLYGLMAGGQEGVERCLEILKTEMTRTMKLLGVSDLSELNPKHLRFLD